MSIFHKADKFLHNWGKFRQEKLCLGTLNYYDIVWSVRFNIAKHVLHYQLSYYVWNNFVRICILKIQRRFYLVLYFQKRHNKSITCFIKVPMVNVSHHHKSVQFYKKNIVCANCVRSHQMIKVFLWALTLEVCVASAKKETTIYQCINEIDPDTCVLQRFVGYVFEQ